ncbi:MAG: 4Fe-4S dicluster domain-containing protein [Candidatus Eremiobacteraeota bacterium]|nr:4Fe-4S dicluster domain-containing protein [Candidatus Eremiobacteraeota bacterium]
MASRYIIKPKPAPGRFPPIPKVLVERGDSCIKCGKCISVCIYDVHERDPSDVRLIADPVSYRCKNCFACVQNCPAGAISIRIHPDFEKLGDDIISPDMLLTIMKEAETGNTTVTGGGYGGLFSGNGFDGMWTDMSEIVRPTRDGIYGREYINTSVDLGRKPPDIRDLRFDAVGNPLTHIPPSLSVNLPILFDTIHFPIHSENILISVARASAELGTLAIIDNDQIIESLGPYSSNIIPSIHPENIPWGKLLEIARKNSIVELFYSPGLSGLPESLKKANSELIVMVRIIEPEDPADISLRLFKEGVDVIHLFSRRNLPEIINRAHSTMIDEKIRDQITIIGSGGIGEAVHVPKAIIIGADLVALSLPLLIAMECTLCMDCEKGKPCYREIDSISPDWGSSRLKNLMAAWHNQLLEILGAMGIREVSRLRGELGRGIFAKDMAREFEHDLLSFKTSRIESGAIT